MFSHLSSASCRPGNSHIPSLLFSCAKQTHSFRHKPGFTGVAGGNDAGRGGDGGCGGGGSEHGGGSDVGSGGNDGGSGSGGNDDSGGGDSFALSSRQEQQSSDCCSSCRRGDWGSYCPCNNFVFPAPSPPELRRFTSRGSYSASLGSCCCCWGGISSPSSFSSSLSSSPLCSFPFLSFSAQSPLEAHAPGINSKGSP